MWRAFFIASGLVLLLFASSHASSFDGAWSVLQVCDSTEEGARRYTWRYDATVKHGHLVGQYRLKGQRPSLTLEGKVEPDGSATLIAEGLSAGSDCSDGSFSKVSRFGEGSEIRIERIQHRVAVGGEYVELDARAARSDLALRRRKAGSHSASLLSSKQC